MFWKFKKIATNIETSPFIREIEDAKRKVKFPRFPHVHREAVHIPLRNPHRTLLTRRIFDGDVHKSIQTPYWHLFPHTTRWLEDFAKFHDARLGRVFIAILRPGGTIHRHFDAGTYFAVVDRYHLVLQSEGTRVDVEGEIKTFHAGEVWIFNNRYFHEFSHASKHERIHLIFDLHAHSFLHKLHNVLQWVFLTTVHRFSGADHTGVSKKTKIERAYGTYSSRKV